MPPPLDFAHDGGALGVEQLHADFDEQLPLPEPVEERVNLLRAVKIQRNDHLFIHGVPLL